MKKSPQSASFFLQLEISVLKTCAFFLVAIVFPYAVVAQRSILVILVRVIAAIHASKRFVGVMALVGFVAGVAIAVIAHRTSTPKPFKYFSVIAIDVWLSNRQSPKTSLVLR